jgi:hypothetical protein
VEWSFCDCRPRELKTLDGLSQNRTLSFHLLIIRGKRGTICHLTRISCHAAIDTPYEAYTLYLNNTIEDCIHVVLCKPELLSISPRDPRRKSFSSIKLNPGNDKSCTSHEVRLEELRACLNGSSCSRLFHGPFAARLLFNKAKNIVLLECDRC